MIVDAQKQVTLAEKRPKIKEILDRSKVLFVYASKIGILRLTRDGNSVSFPF